MGEINWKSIDPCIRSGTVGWKQSCLDVLTYFSTSACGGKQELPTDPEKIFVLRNNDIGDLLVTTPVFEALKRRFPKAKLIAGVGDWNRDVLLNNPWIDQVFPCNAPWHNKFVGHGSSKGSQLFGVLAYLLNNPEVAALRAEKISLGIDILGCWQGSLLFMSAGIRSTVGVNGYAGGHLSTTVNLIFDPDKYVGQAILDQAALVGVTEFPRARPQLFLSGKEKAEASARWDAEFESHSKRIVICPGGGYPQKCRSTPFFLELVHHLQSMGYHIAIVGSDKDAAVGEALAQANPAVRNWCGLLSLRQSFAVFHACDVVVCHSSMALHAAAAFDKPTLLLLTEMFDAPHHQRSWGYPFPCITLGMTGQETISQQMASAREGLKKILPLIPFLTLGNG